VPLSTLSAFVGVPATPGWDDVAVTGITHDSSDVRPGDLFAALPGARHHGTEFLADAVERGAVAVLTDARGRPAAQASGLPSIVVLDPRAVLGPLAAEVYGHPAEHLLVLGVTGTNGKTTTAHLLDAALRHAGHLPGLLGTIETRVGDEVFTSVRTTPESTDLQATLATMLERGADAVVMEASSIAVEMGRVDGLVFDVVGFTNLSQDHLDFHPDMAAYFRAKAALFTPVRARHGVVVVDDEYGERLAREATIPVTTVSVGGRDADWRVTDISTTRASRTRFSVLTPGGAAVDAEIGLPGRFNVANAVLAIAMLAEAGTDVRVAADGVATCTGVPGRMERVDRGQDFLAVVDYAHTPGAVGAVLRDLRTSTTGAVIAVLGCGGDRDAAKRPLMGAAAVRGADVVVVTDDNPRSEEPEAIRSAVLAGIGRVLVEDGLDVDVLEIADRTAAIREAVARARTGDTVLVAGKGHEQGQEVAGVITPFDDRAVLAAALEEVVTP
jgi:UDP-N-acetylmuramoyl-L-alanyl-D-glutamate--2,6-diaminopimelate ligase